MDEPAINKPGVDDASADELGLDDSEVDDTETLPSTGLSFVIDASLRVCVSLEACT